MAPQNADTASRQRPTATKKPAVVPNVLNKMAEGRLLDLIDVSNYRCEIVRLCLLYHAVKWSSRP